MKSPLLLGGLMVVIAAVVPASAATLHNMETSPQTVKITAAGKSSDLTLKASEVKKDVCGTGCEMTFGTQKLTLKGSEIVNLEAGKLMVQ
jgi:hypothetical protein